MEAWSPAPRPAASPTRPGSYQFIDADGRVIYVGKAKSLRSRLSNYFLQPYLLPERTRQMVQAAERVEWIVVAQRGRGVLPRVQPHQAAPAPLQHPAEGRQVVPVPRGHARRGVAARDGAARRRSARASATSGPYAHAYAIRETLDLLLRTFPIRTCTKAKFDRHHRLGRPCLYAHIEKCAAPCVDAIDHEEYDGLVDGADRLPRRRARRRCSTRLESG